MLKDLTGYIYEIINQEFKIEMGESLFYAEKLKQDIKPQFTIESSNAEIKEMFAEINVQLQKTGKNYELVHNIYEAKS
jgi:hypothetical protein